jgi:hypothetical protein
MAKEELETRITELETINKELESQTERLEAVLDIINLQTRYNLWLESGYYNRIWNELFAHNDPRVKCEIGESGVYEGPESVKRLWMALAGRERRRGYMANIMVMTPYIVVSKDGKTAKGMWWAFGPHSDYVTPSPGDEQKLTAYWYFGKYDNEFVKEGGKWKFLSLHTIVYIRTPYDQGWLKEPDCARWQVPEGAPPDKPPTLFATYHPDGVAEWRPWPYAYEPIIT